MDWDDIQREFDRVNAMSCKPVGMQKYKAGHIFDENMSVKWNRDKLAEENKKFQDEVARLNTLKNKGFLAVHELVYQKIQEDIGHDLPRAAAEKIFPMRMRAGTSMDFMMRGVSWNGWLSWFLKFLKCRKEGRKSRMRNKDRQPYLPRSDNTGSLSVHKRIAKGRKMKKFFLTIALLASLLLCSCGSEADKANYNISKQADYFESERKITVYNARTDTVILEAEGYMSISNNSNNELVCTVKIGPDTYRKNYIYLNDYTMYVVEDITGTHTDPYHYKLYFHTDILPSVEAKS